MTNRLISVLVTLFWLVMMGTLVRLEYFPRPQDTVPTQQILDLIFTQPQQRQNFIVFYQGREIGVLDLDVEPITQRVASAETAGGTTNKVTGYIVGTAANLDLKYFDIDSRFALTTRNEITTDYQLQDFDVLAALGADRLILTGSKDNKLVNVQYNISGRRGRTTLDLSGKDPGALNGLLGLTGLTQLDLIGGALNFAMTPTANGQTKLQPTVTGYRGQLVVQGVPQHMYVMEAKVHEGLWAKLWVSKSGEIILLDSSADMALKNSTLFPAEDTDILKLRPPPVPIERMRYD